MSDAWDWTKGAVGDAIDWVGGALGPKHANVPRAPVSPYGTDVKWSMENQQRNPANYLVGEQMSQPMNDLAASGLNRGIQAQQTLGDEGRRISGTAQNASMYGAQGAAYGARGDAYGQQGAGYGAYGYQSGQGAQQLGQALHRDAQAAGQRMESAGSNAANIANQGVDRSEQARQQMMGSADQLRGLESQQGPSAAQAQLQSGLNRAMDQNLALARSGSGFGGNAGRFNQALRQNASMGQEAANQSATLRAQEDAAWRQRQASNLGAAGNLYGASGGLGLNQGQLGLAGNQQLMGGIQGGAGLGLAGGQAGMQGFGMGMQGAQTGIQGAQAGMQGAQTGIQGAQTGIGGTAGAVQGMQAGADTIGKGFGLGFMGDQQAGQAYAQDQQAKQAYEQMLTQNRGIDAGVAVSNAQASNQFMGSLMSAAATMLPFLFMSDEDEKEVGEEVKMSSETYGNPYGSRGAPGKLSGWKSFDEAMRRARREQSFTGEQLDEMEGIERMGVGRSGGSPLVQGPGGPQYDAAMKSAQDAQLREASSQKSNQAAAGMLSSLLGNLASGYGGQSSPYSNPFLAQYGNPYVMSDEEQKDTSFRDVKAYRYRYKDPSLPGAEPGEHIGPMAQDVERVAPDAVVESPYGKMVRTDRLALPLASAVGELQERLDRLEEGGATRRRPKAENA